MRRAAAAISRDADWQAFADTSAHLVCNPNYQAVLDQFNEAGRLVAERAVAMLQAGEAPALAREIELEIEAWLDDNDFEIEANTDFYYDAEPESAVMQTWDIVAPPKVLSVEGEEVTFSIELDCLIAFAASFDLSVRDSVDRDYVKLNSQTVEIDARQNVTVIVTLLRTFAPEPEVVALEVNRHRLYVDFGNVDLDWSYQD